MEIKPIRTELEDSIISLVKSSKMGGTEAALKYSQAALNLAHVLHLVKGAS